MTAETSAIVAPRPPSSAGTASARKPRSRRWSNESPTHEPSRSWRQAEAASATPASAAHARRSSARSAPAAGGVIVMVIMSIEHRDEYGSLPVRDLDPTGTDSGLHPAA